MLDTVTVHCDGRFAGPHVRTWARQQVVTDPVHAATATGVGEALALERQ